MAKLLNKKPSKASGGEAEYEEWNIVLAKKFHGLNKTFQKFASKFLEAAEGVEEEKKVEEPNSQQDSAKNDQSNTVAVEERVTRGRLRKA